MPCFKGLAVSIHTPDGPIPEYSIQKHARASRITAYIPVPPAKIPGNSLTGKPEQSSFAVSITLLTPGIKVPYSVPAPTPEDPYPTGRIVGGLPGMHGERGRFEPVVVPYIPRTTSPNETLAAYIYFDGRVKEEVATLLRRGEETWVNSRWVSVPESEGGGLAEREFLFREVGLERWLNGLDLQGKDKAARIEKRQRKLEKRRRMKQEHNSDDEEEEQKPKIDNNGVLRYSNEQSSPVESIKQEDRVMSDSDDSDDDPPEAEAAGQIKIALYRVLASGEIKRGEYEPQFDVNDEDGGEPMEGGDDEEVDHTTGFAKPKALDPKSISTQTVTGIDPPEAPYVVFTFLYRGEKQLQKMGIVNAPAVEPVAPLKAKRKSIDFSKLGPLKKSEAGPMRYSSYRDSDKAKSGAAIDEDAMESDDEVDRRRAKDNDDDKEVTGSNGVHLSPDDARKQGELAEGVGRLKLKRAHSAEVLGDQRKSPHVNSSGSASIDTPQSVDSTSANAGTPAEPAASPLLAASEQDVGIASPFKKQRASMPGLEPAVFTAENVSKGSQDANSALQAAISTALPPAASAAAPIPTPPLPAPQSVAHADSDEEL